jgi:hypothetical protein
MVRLSEDEYKYLQSLKNRFSFLTTSEAVRYLIHRFKELEERGYVVVGGEIFEVLYKNLYKIAMEELRKELNRLFKNSSNKPRLGKPKSSNSV